LENMVMPSARRRSSNTGLRKMFKKMCTFCTNVPFVLLGKTLYFEVKLSRHKDLIE